MLFNTSLAIIKKYHKYGLCLIKGLANKKIKRYRSLGDGSPRALEPKAVGKPPVELIWPLGNGVNPWYTLIQARTGLLERLAGLGVGKAARYGFAILLGASSELGAAAVN